MKAIRVTEPFKVEIVDVPKPEIKKSDDVIIKITSGGICGSDIGIWNGTNSLATYPRIIGHEFGGIVTEVGEGVTKVKIGDKVAVDPVESCGHCYVCRIGRHNVCSTLEVTGVHRDGGFSEYIVANEKNVHKFNVDFDSTLLGLVEPYTIGVEINNRGQIGQGDHVLIMGCGPIGICTMQVAKRNGARVIMTDCMIGLKGFAAGVIGGFGYLPGGILGGILIGVLESLSTLVVPGIYKDTVSFILLIVFLLVKPNGILGHKA